MRLCRGDTHRACHGSGVAVGDRAPGGELAGQQDPLVVGP
jgi:hypothetical protein